MNWLGYCKTIGLGSGGDAVKARICASLNAQMPHEAREKIERLLVAGKIDGESYAIQIEAVERLVEMRAAGVQTHQVPVHNGLWRPLKNGGHMTTDMLSGMGD